MQMLIDCRLHGSRRNLLKDRVELFIALIATNRLLTIHAADGKHDSMRLASELKFIPPGRMIKRSRCSGIELNLRHRAFGEVIDQSLLRIARCAIGTRPQLTIDR